MLVTTNGQRTLWETILPPGYQDLPAELVAVDALLDDPVFVEPYRAHFSAVMGRPSIPIETYLRMMFLKHRYGLGYETLVSGGGRLDLLVAVLPDPAGDTGAAPVDVGQLTAHCGASVIEQADRGGVRGRGRDRGNRETPGRAGCGRPLRRAETPNCSTRSAAANWTPRSTRPPCWCGGSTASTNAAGDHCHGCPRFPASCGPTRCWAHG